MISAALHFFSLMSHNDSITQARQLVREFLFTNLPTGSSEEFYYYNGKSTRCTNQWSAVVLAVSFDFFIRIEQNKTPKADVLLGASKRKGLPHMPQDWEWPAGCYFYAQPNLAEVHPTIVPAGYPQPASFISLTMQR